MISGHGGVKVIQVTIPLNIVIFFGVPVFYDIVIKGKSAAVWGLHPRNIRKSVLLGSAISVLTFPVVYVVFKVVFGFSTQEFVQAGTVAYYFYSEFAYPFNIIYYSVWTLSVIALGEELFFRGFIHNKLEQRLSFAYAALTSSAIFTATHLMSITLFPLPMMVTYLALTFIFSLLLACTLHYTGNLIGCWFSHAISNILAGIFIGIL